MARNNFIETRNLPLFIVFDLIKNTLFGAFPTWISFFSVLVLFYYCYFFQFYCF